MIEHATIAFVGFVLAFGAPVLLLTWRTELHEREREMRKGQQ